MAAEYLSRAGDTVDLIAWRFYGSAASRMVERLLSANAGLADLGPTLPAGVRIALPEAAIIQPVATSSVKLWD